MDEESQDVEYGASFEGECTCEHEQGQHSWGICGQANCKCEAGWCE